MFANIFVNGGSLSTYRRHERKSLNRHFFLQLRLNSEMHTSTLAQSHMCLQCLLSFHLKNGISPGKTNVALHLRSILVFGKAHPIDIPDCSSVAPPITGKQFGQFFNCFLIVHFVIWNRLKIVAKLNILQLHPGRIV